MSRGKSRHGRRRGVDCFSSLLSSRHGFRFPPPPHIIMSGLAQTHALSHTESYTDREREEAYVHTHARIRSSHPHMLPLIISSVEQLERVGDFAKAFAHFRPSPIDCSDGEQVELLVSNDACRDHVSLRRRSTSSSTHICLEIHLIFELVVFVSLELRLPRLEELV